MINESAYVLGYRTHMVEENFEVYHLTDQNIHDVPLHHHNFYEVYYLLNGNVQYVIENKIYDLVPGDILFISPNEVHQPIFNKTQLPYERIVLWINKNYIDSFSTPRTNITECFELAKSHHLHRLLPVQRQIVNIIFERLIQSQEEKQFGSDIAPACNLLLLLIEFKKYLQDASEKNTNKASLSNTVINVIDYINENYPSKITLDQLSEQFYVSKYHLSHEFNRHIGVSVYRYILQKRLTEAKKMMSAGTPPTQVFQLCGFTDYSNFYRLFKTEYSITPKEFFNYANSFDKM